MADRLQKWAAGVNAIELTESREKGIHRFATELHNAFVTSCSREGKQPMVCDDVKRVVYFFLDGSLSEPKLLEFTSHLELCRDCDDRTTVSKKLRSFIRRRLSPVGAPEQLKVRLTQTIREIQPG